MALNLNQGIVGLLTLLVRATTYAVLDVRGRRQASTARAWVFGLTLAALGVGATIVDWRTAVPLNLDNEVAALRRASAGPKLGE